MNAETCGFRSAKAWLEINRRVQSTRTHLHPAGRQVSVIGSEANGEGAARFLCPVVISSPGISPFLWGRGFFVRLCRVHFNQWDYPSPPPERNPQILPATTTLKGLTAAVV